MINDPDFVSVGLFRPMPFGLLFHSPSSAMPTYAGETAPKDERLYKQQHLQGAAVGKAPANSGLLPYQLKGFQLALRIVAGRQLVQGMRGGGPCSCFSLY
jgi:hypothetical protein